jgi:phosphoglycerate dehydrogenase-like enzyme
MSASLLISRQMAVEHGAALAQILAAAPRRLELLHFEPGVAYSSAQIASIEVAFYSRDIWEGTRAKHRSPQGQAFWSLIDAAPNLQWLQLVSAGLDHPVYQPSMQRGVRISTAAGTNAEPVALNALTGLLMLSRDFPHWLRAQQQKVWAPIQDAQLPRDLQGQTAVIVGVGHIGTRIARGLQALGMRTIGLRRQAQPAEFFDEVRGLEAIDTVLPRCDWLVLACPLTEQTRRLVDARRLALLPRGAGLVNIARGEIVDEAALIESLASGHLLGAYLDVFVQEPLPPESPLWTLPQVLMTPHSASASLGTRQRGAELFLRNLQAYLQGAALESETARG